MADTRDGARTMDLSKGAIPVVLVCALLVSAYWIGISVAGINAELEQQGEAVSEVKANLQALTPIIGDVANATAGVSANAAELKTLERDLALLDSRLRRLEVDAEVVRRASE